MPKVMRIPRISDVSVLNAIKVSLLCGQACRSPTCRNPSDDGTMFLEYRCFEPEFEERAHMRFTADFQSLTPTSKAV